MAVEVYPTAQLREQVQSLRHDSSLEPSQRIRRLRVLADEAHSILSMAEAAIGDARMEDAAGALSRDEKLTMAREEADLRGELERRDMVPADKLDEARMPTHADLDAREADGSIDDYLDELLEVYWREWLFRRAPSGTAGAGQFASKPGEVSAPKPRTRTGSKIDVPTPRKPAAPSAPRTPTPRAPTPPKPKAAPKPSAPKKPTPPKPTRTRTPKPKVPKGGPKKPDAPTGSGTKEDPLKTGDVEVAAEALADGKHVELAQTDQVSTLLDKLRTVVAESREKGEDAPNYDLCNVTVAGTNLFCVESKGIPRVQMPQLKGPEPTPGSKADQLERDERGEVSIEDEFVTHLIDQGIKVTEQKKPASHLKATQRELNGAKVAGIAGALEDGVIIDGALFTSRDNYVVDGHHRWAATIGVDAADGKVGELDLDVREIDADIITILGLANAFAEDWGIPQAAIGAGFGNTEARDAKLTEPGAVSVPDEALTQEAATDLDQAAGTELEEDADGSGDGTGGE